MAESKFILEDFSRDPIDGLLKNVPLREVNNNKWLGHCLCLTPFESHTLIDYTGPVGSSSGLYYSLMFQLGKWEFKVMKADEWIEVSPAFSQYYQITLKQKEDLEAKIKSGLASAAQAVADMELLKHDERKYREFLDYFGFRTFKEIKKENPKKFKEIKKKVIEINEDELYIDEDEKERQKRADEHYLRAVFIDQVDAHTGEGISMRSIVSRWPTLIVDFQKLNDKLVDTKDVSKELEISKAEATVLATKNRLYIEWKKLFLPELRNRYKRIRGLVTSREKSVKEYREWLKPVVARHKLIEEGLSRPDVQRQFKTSFISSPGQATSSSVTEIWTWRGMSSPEYFKAPGEILAKHPVEPDDEWTRKNLIFHPKHGLVIKYPWINEKWVEEKKKEFFDKGLIKKHELYYSFLIIKLQRTNLRSATGDELEDGQFDVNAIFMSQNALFVKLLELKAKEESLNHYVDNMIGVAGEKTGSKFGEEKDRLSAVKKFFDLFSIGLQFRKSGPYERDFDERITKYYLLPMARDRYTPIIGFIKDKIGFGK